MANWLNRRLESILDNIIFAGVVAVVVAVLGAVKSLPLPWVVGIFGGVIVFVLAVIRLIVLIIHKPKKGTLKVNSPPTETRITNDEKTAITTLMELSSAVEHKLEQFFEQSLNGFTDADERVAKYESLKSNTEFQELWERYLAKRAVVSVISPELDDGMRLLLSLLDRCYRVTLSKQYVDELPALSKLVGDVATTTENIRKKNVDTIRKMIGRGEQ